MPLGEILVAKNLLSGVQLEEALERQKIAGGFLGDNIVALGFAAREELEAVLQEPPHTPGSMAEAGLSVQFLLQHVLKCMYTLGVQTVPEISNQTKLSRRIVEDLLQILKKGGSVEVRGASEANVNILYHALTGMGRERAVAELAQCQYVGPCPVPLADYQVQIHKQTITNERIGADVLFHALSHLVLPVETVRRLGPAVNSGKAILLYGPSGNGKTSIAEAIGRAFQQNIYIPHAVEVGGQIIKVFDQAFHKEIVADGQNDKMIHIQQSGHDLRWVRCRRPFTIAGGELTLQMLDLDFDPHSKSYEAPLQVKAQGGVFLIDDFGRQLVRPHDLLNRWIVPMERKVDYLTLHTGKKFELPFDELIIFATNLSPEDLVDPGLLRRMGYKIRIAPPTVDDYKAMFCRVCDAYRLELRDDLLSYILSFLEKENNTSLAMFQPKFIVEQTIAACKYEGIPPQLNQRLVQEALQNLVVRESPSTQD